MSCGASARPVAITKAVAPEIPLATHSSSANAISAPDLLPARWRLPALLLTAVESQAAIEGVAADVIAARVVETGLRELGLTPHGRCSIRTGLCGGGPEPLAIQQHGSAVTTP